MYNYASCFPCISLRPLYLKWPCNVQRGRKPPDRNVERAVTLSLSVHRFVFGFAFFFLLLFLYSSPAKKRQKIVGFSVCRWCHVKSYKFSYPPPLAAPCFYFFSGTTVYLRACLSLIKQTRSVPFRIPTPSQTRQSKRNVHTVPHHRASSSGMNTTKPTCFHLQPCHQTHKCICIYIYIHTYTHP